MLVYGRNVAYEILKYDIKSIRKIFFQIGFNDKKIFSLVENVKIDIQFKKKSEMDNLANGVHQGIILDVMDYRYYSLEDVFDEESNFVVVLDHLEDPHNLGAIIRTCEAASVDFIIVPQDRSILINPTVMKTSAGSLVRSKVVKVPNLVNAINKLKDNGFWIVGTDMSGQDLKLSIILVKLVWLLVMKVRECRL